MKKVLMAITIALVFSLVACSEGEKDYKTSFELMQDLKDLKDVEGLINSRILGQSENDLETVKRWLSAQDEDFDLTAYIDGAVISPMMNVDARAVLILRFDGTEDASQVKVAMENFSRFLICVSIENYEITNVGSTYIFSGVADNTEVIETFKNLDFERATISEESSMIEVAMKVVEDASITLSNQTTVFSDEFSLGQLEYMIGQNLGVNTSLIESGLMSYSYDGDALFAIFKSTDVNTSKQEITALNNFFKETLNQDFEIEGSIVVYNDFVIYTNSADKAVLEEVIKSFN